MNAVIDEPSLIRRPPWRVLLSGAEADLQDLCRTYSSGQVHVAGWEYGYYLEADQLNCIREINGAFQASDTILRILNSNCSHSAEHNTRFTHQAGTWA